jgi:hypothetical protein
MSTIKKNKEASKSGGAFECGLEHFSALTFCRPADASRTGVLFVSSVSSRHSGDKKYEREMFPHNLPNRKGLQEPKKFDVMPLAPSVL